jgi:hypothetical protein
MPCCHRGSGVGTWYLYGAERLAARWASRPGAAFYRRNMIITRKRGSGSAQRWVVAKPEPRGLGKFAWFSSEAHRASSPRRYI